MVEMTEKEKEKVDKWLESVNYQHVPNKTIQDVSLTMEIRKYIMDEIKKRSK